MTSGVSPPSGELGDDLVAIYEGRLVGTSEAREDVATAWIHRLHGAFYGRELARVPNKFQHLEKVLADAFARVNEGDADRSAFWHFATGILVQLASNDCANSPLPAGTLKKKSKVKAQPTSPLAFLVVNALKALMEGDEAGEHRGLCRIQGEANAELRAFCVSGLRSGSTVVSACAEYLS